MSHIETIVTTIESEELKKAIAHEMCSEHDRDGSNGTNLEDILAGSPQVSDTGPRD